MSLAGSRPYVESATGSSPKPEIAAALHRLRSTLARLKAELELAHVDGATVPVEILLGDLRESLTLLSSVEDIAFDRVGVLVVDDDERLAEITARGLRRLGFDATSSKGLRSLRRREILVLDLSLVPGLDANSVAAVRAAQPIVVTGATDARSRALATGLDASDYLLKPVELDDLAAAINRRIEGARR
jgi:CheY-like chemotaxis protein